MSEYKNSVLDFGSVEEDLDFGGFVEDFQAPAWAFSWLKTTFFSFSFSFSSSLDLSNFPRSQDLLGATKCFPASFSTLQLCFFPKTRVGCPSYWNADFVNYLSLESASPANLRPPTAVIRCQLYLTATIDLVV